MRRRKRWIVVVICGVAAVARGALPGRELATGGYGCSMVTNSLPGFHGLGTKVGEIEER
jgi:hypothetical protein